MFALLKLFNGELSVFFVGHNEFLKKRVDFSSVISKILAQGDNSLISKFVQTYQLIIEISLRQKYDDKT